ncbi:MAG TPA: acyl carrier protein [Thermodesulfovibrionales bacterium]|nr:acyl carrier protein [Thermodesulfovibrionales bacterium]
MDEVMLQKLSEIFSYVFEYGEVLNLNTKREDIPKWDSLQHVALVESLENTFNIHISMDEMIEMQSIRDIINVLSRHDIL